MRLSSGPEHSMLTNRPVIVTQSVLPSSPPLPLRKRGSPYSGVVRRAAAYRSNRYNSSRRVRTNAMLVGSSGGSCSDVGNDVSERKHPRCVLLRNLHTGKFLHFKNKSICVQPVDGCELEILA